MTNSQSPLPLKSFVAIDDDAWEHIRPYLLASSQNGGRTPIDCRKSLEGMRWVASTGKPWAEMPPDFGNWGTVRRYYARLGKRGVIDKLLTAFPKSTSMPTAKTTALLAANHHLACLKNLTERRPRGRAGRAKSGQQ